MKRIFIIMVVFLSFCTQATAQNDGLSFLEIGISGRATGMAEAYSAVVEDASATYWNPAGLAGIQRANLLIHHSEWLQDIRSEFVAAAFLLSSWRVGFSFLSASVGGFELRDQYPSTTPLSTFEAQDVAAGISIAKHFRPDMSFGVTAKFLYEKIYVEESTGLAVDVGAVYHPVRLPVRLALVIQNLGSMSRLYRQAPELPGSVRLGMAVSPWREQLNHRLLVAADLVSTFDSDVHLNVGSEFWLSRLLAARVGYQTGFASKNIHFGFGLQLARFQLDYAFTPFRYDLGSGHRFSLLFEI